MKQTLALLLCLLAGCSRAPLTDPAKAFRLGDAPARLEDTLEIGTLRAALERNLRALANPGGTIPAQYTFGERSVSREDYRRALEALRPELESWERLLPFVRENFDFYEVYGGKGWGEVFSTGYYEPVVPGSPHRTDRFTRPLYRSPGDLVSIDVGAFAERLSELEPLRNILTEQKAKSPVWRGRYIAKEKRVVPYYERAEIDGASRLAGQKLELVWLDPVDAFFLEIQGSGLVELPGRSLRVGYAAQNGAAYLPIGKFLTNVIPLEQMSMQRIRRHLATLSAAERDAVLFKNPSYVFFRALEGQPLSYSGAEVTGGRTVATDRGLFPKGTLAFFDIEEPVFSDEAAIDPAGWEPKPRFVFDQDTGGAIRGGGRVDLYMGRGPEAEQKAGVMKRDGRLWALVPKEGFLERLRAAR